MSYSTLVHIQNRCVALYDDSLRDYWVNQAKELIHQSVFGDYYNLAVALRACHDYTSNKGNAREPGRVTSKSIAGVFSVAHQSVTGKMANDPLNSTVYGIELLNLPVDVFPATILKEVSHA